MAQQGDIRYLTPINIEITKEKFCRFRKSRIKYIDYKDGDFLLKFVKRSREIASKKNYWNIS